MGCITHIRHILKRDGTNQFERMLDALRPGFVNIDERSREDLVSFIRGFSRLISYYDLEDKPDGDWEPFFEDFSREQEPHLALALAFLDLFSHAQDRINELTLRHLEFYYKKVLQVKERKAVPDRVHLLFELAKNAGFSKLEKGTLVKAGKDNTGKEVYFTTEREIVINRAEVSQLKSVYVSKVNDHRIYAAPVANSADGKGKPIEGDEPRWHAFGQDQLGLPAKKRTMADAAIGFAVASPLLYLGEGKRTITLEATFHSLQSGAPFTLGQVLGSNFTGAFQASLTGQKKWEGPYPVSVSKSKDNKGLVFKVLLDASQPQVIAYDPKVHLGGFSTGYPLVKLILSHDRDPYAYGLLKNLALKSLTLSVNVDGIQDLALQNDLGPVDAAKPFQPFGPSPVKGSMFYIGSGEVFCKKLTKLELAYKWKDLPGVNGGFDRYYNAYDRDYTNDGFTAEAAALHGKEWTGSSNRPEFTLFSVSGPGSVPARQNALGKATTGNKKASKKSYYYKENRGSTTSASDKNVPKWMRGRIRLSMLDSGEIRRSVNTAKFSLSTLKKIEKVSSFSPRQLNGFLRLELTGQDFGHAEYPAAQTKKAIEVNQYYLDNPGGQYPPELPNRPYTPVMEYLKVNYTASETMNMSSGISGEGVLELFHVEAFGEAPAGDRTRSGLLPSYPFQGSLYIGIGKLSPRQNLSLLFQVAESSNDPNFSALPDEIGWSYLGEDDWVSMRKQDIITDSTNGLLNSGIVEFDISASASSSNPLMPQGFHWLRATVNSNVGAMNQLIGVRAQAVTAVFDDQGNDPSRLAAPLKAGSISKMAVQQPAIKKVVQPFASFGSSEAEDSGAFNLRYYTRVSERLRHRNRAITVWDMERMILEAFPGIYKVKCLNHSSDEDDIAPGHVTAVIIENIRNKNAVDPLQPRTSATILDEIRKFLAKYVSPFTTVHVQNPVYEEILVDFKVAFLPGFDAGYYHQQLNEEIKRYLSPWAYIEGEDIIFGNTIFKSSIMNFVEERSYVDFVADFRMYQLRDSWGIGCMVVEDDFVVGDSEKLLSLDEATAKTSRSILVSAPEHDIKVLGTDEIACKKIEMNKN